MSTTGPTTGKGGGLCVVVDRLGPKYGLCLLSRRQHGPFVTIHDFITTAHPWLQTVRDDILTAMGLTEDGALPVDTPLCVYPLGLDRLRLVEGRNGQPNFESAWKGLATHAQRHVDGTWQDIISDGQSLLIVKT